MPTMLTRPHSENGGNIANHLHLSLENSKGALFTMESSGSEVDRVVCRVRGWWHAYQKWPPGWWQGVGHLTIAMQWSIRGLFVVGLRKNTGLTTMSLAEFCGIELKPTKCWMNG